MKFALQLKIDVADGYLDATNLSNDADAYKEALANPSDVDGMIAVEIDGQTFGDNYSDPLLRLAADWVRKVPWILAGDTETIALRNSGQCFAFVPTGESVELSFFEGTEMEIEEYILEPTTVRLQHFIEESLELGDQLIALWANADGAASADEDYRDLSTLLDEAKTAWHDFQLHQRR